MPEAYQTGLQNFYGHDFFVSPAVLIPRPETEMLIDAVLNLAGKSFLPGVKPAPAKVPENVSILDVGTGSGCIAITLKLELPEATVFASDISKEALKIAKKNAEKFQAAVSFFQSNLLENLTIEKTPVSKTPISENSKTSMSKTSELPTPEIIVANLPYVDENWDWLDHESLSFEPKTALFAKDNGLFLIKKLIQTLPEKTKFLILEADPVQHESLVAFANIEGLSLLETREFILVFTKN